MHVRVGLEPDELSLLAKPIRGPAERAALIRDLRGALSGNILTVDVALRDKILARQHPPDSRADESAWEPLLRRIAEMAGAVFEAFDNTSPPGVAPRTRPQATRKRRRTARRRRVG